MNLLTLKYWGNVLMSDVFQAQRFLKIHSCGIRSIYTFIVEIISKNTKKNVI